MIFGIGVATMNNLNKKRKKQQRIMENSRHQFALYYAQTDSLREHNELTDFDMYHRLVRVLRIKPREQVVFFDERGVWVLITCVDFLPKTVRYIIERSGHASVLTPEIHWILPLLEKEAFEQALSFLTVLGAQHIYPIVTTKTKAPAQMLLSLEAEVTNVFPV